MSNLDIACETPKGHGVDLTWTPGSLLKKGTYTHEKSFGDDKVSESGILETFNTAMSTISELTSLEVSPLTFQLNCNWDEASQEEKNICTEKAEEICRVVCEVVAPSQGEKLFDSLKQANSSGHSEISGDLIALMTAYSNASTRRLKTQILSIYAYRYPVEKLLRIHEPYEKITKWQVKQARAHARALGPGTLPEKKNLNRIRIDRVKADHFIEFINRPYFYQDVAYGMRPLVLKNGQKIEMPNIVRTV